jgi:hypothetical protein
VRAQLRPLLRLVARLRVVARLRELVVGAFAGAVVYEISYNTSTHGRFPSVASPSDSLNVAVTDVPSVGASTDANIWIDGVANAGVGNHAPAAQFKAGNGS